VITSQQSRLNGWIKTADSPAFRQRSLDIAMVIVRLALAWIFIYYGAGKLFGWFHGAGLNATATFFATTAHLHPGKLFAVLSGVTEFGGGIALAIGFLGRLAALGLLFDMVIAMLTVTFQNGLIGNSSGVGYGLNVALAALCAAVILLGTGRYSLGARLHTRRLAS
jgi:putative oxidoreductase